MCIQVDDYIKISSKVSYEGYNKINLFGREGTVKKIYENKCLIRLGAEGIAQYSADEIDVVSENDLTWKEVWVPMDAVSKAEGGIDEDQLAIEKLKILEVIHWIGHGKIYGKRVAKVIRNVVPGNIEEGLKAWFNFLNNNLSLPQKGKIAEFASSISVTSGTPVVIEAIEYYTELKGVLVGVSGKFGECSIPLHMIELDNASADDYWMIDDYCKWFENK